ncbi:hypothetical protein PFTANZ_06600, partial [Plasmodium falciparum Tanzania (2000708)]
MLCALENFGAKNEILTKKYEYSTLKFSDTNDSPKLTDFVTRPQFLRWFTEWGEDFCREQKKEFRKLVDGCNGYECNGDNGDKKKKCNDACQKYKKFISEWKPQYEKQIKKYGENKDKIYSEHHVAKDAKDARDYLDKTLQNFCQNGSTNENCDYMCMGNTSKQQKQASDNTDMPASLDEEPQEVKAKCTCPPPPKPKPAGESLARSLPPVKHDEDGNPSDEEEEDEDEIDDVEVDGSDGAEEEEEEDEGDDDDEEDTTVENHTEAETEEGTEQVEEEEEEAASTTKTPKQDGQGPKEEKGPKVEDICATVAKALTGDTTALQDACTLKYSGNNSRLGWRCVPTSGDKTDTSGGRVARSAPSGDQKTTTSSDSGSICVPPRRRKLYLHDLKTLGEADKTPTDTQLLEWFVKSAAVETFFAWHKYKMDKEIEKKEKNRADGRVYALKDDNEEAQKQLNDGTIPEEFKRQMFYTL